LIYEGKARRLVLRLKHGDRTDMAKPLAGWMERKARDLIEKESVLVPVPLHWKRLLRRKYNQSSLLAAELARRFGVDHCPDALLRQKATDPMSGDRASRIKALRGAIVLNEKHSKVLRGRPILLVDDVMTSGATLEAAATAIADALPSKIDVITLARVAKDL
jgi:ComF family protein